MIVIYIQKDIERAIERFIHQREIVGLSRDDAKQMALNDVEEMARGRQSLADESIIPDDDQTRLNRAARKVTDKLPPIGVRS